MSVSPFDATNRQNLEIPKGNQASNVFHPPHATTYISSMSVYRPTFVVAALGACLVMAMPAVADSRHTDADDTKGKLDIDRVAGPYRRETPKRIWREWRIRMHDNWGKQALGGNNEIRIRIDATGGSGAERTLLVGDDYFVAPIKHGKLTEDATKVKRPTKKLIVVLVDQDFLNYDFPQTVGWWVKTRYDDGAAAPCKDWNPCRDRAPNRGRVKSVI